MKSSRALRFGLASAISTVLGGCLSSRPVPPPQPPPQAAPPPAAVATSPAPPDAVPDAVPRYEPHSRYGNGPTYEVFGKSYVVLSTSADFVERGVASWYGPGFHQVLTSTREPYDMYGMSAAHKTLPLPCYVRVTNLENGRSIVVRVNDRGPFVGNRIIDLSYTAAAKLDMLRNGTAMVEIRTVGPASPAGAAPQPTQTTAQPSGTPNGTPWVSGLTTLPAAASNGAMPAVPPGAPAVLPAPVTSTPVAALSVQAGAFADPSNAQRLADKLRAAGYGKVLVRDDVIAGRRMYRVRIGPVPNVPKFDRIVAELERMGVHDAHLALD